MFPFQNGFSINFSNLGSKKNCFLFGLLLTFSLHQATAQLNWDQSTLNFNGIGESTNGFTSMMFGPDGRLYVAEYHGLIKIFTIERQSSTNYEVTAVEVLDGIQTMEDHNDDGSGYSSLERETTGLTVAGTSANPIIYVTSSDFRIGSGPGGGNGDVGLDTNSGVITRFTWTGSTWDVVDLVRGLPRSEENHATNGLEFVQINGTNYLLVTSGGITNAGSPSTNFVFTCEYALSGAILSVDLDAINSLPILTDSGRQYIYDLPTLDDPTRPNLNGITDPNDPGYTGQDINDPWGGNDGLNMAIIDPAGPVQIFSPGYRNAYDLVVTESGAVYATDNGANGGWGGFPINEGTPNANNNYDPNETGSTFATQAPDGERILNEDHLELITTDLSSYTFGSFYAGHPNPIRANPSGAGLYTVDDSSSVWRTMVYDPDGSSPNSTTDSSLGLPANWPPVNTANPVEGDWRGPSQTNPDGPDNDPVLVWGTNTNGIDEYTATNFGGLMQGNLIAGVNNGVLRRVELNPDGTVSNFTSEFFSGLGGNALAITCNSDLDNFPGTIWAGTLGGNIIIFEPQDFIECVLPGELDYDPLADNDSDGYTNSDEDQNGTDLCNGGSQPNDFDKAAGGILVSDLLDNDDDFDGIADGSDPFQLGNPTVAGSDAFTIPISNDLFNDQQQLGGIFGLGMTGLMNNGDPNENWLNWIDRRDDPNDPNPNDVLGGAPGLMTSHMTSGTALGATNTQEKGYQYGVQSESSIGSYTVVGGMVGFTGGLRLYGNTAAIGGELGFFIGDGTQSNYIKFTVDVDGFEVLQEINDVPQAPINSTLLEAERPATTGGIRFFFVIEPSSGNVTCQYSIDGGAKVTVGTIAAQGTVLEAIQQSSRDLAVGFIGTSGVSGVELEGTWDFLNVLFEEPFIVQDLPDIERPLGEMQESINLSNYFDDNDGEFNLTYSIQTNTNVNFTPVITGSQLDISLPNLIESSDITIRATDQGGFFVDDTFTISINNGPVLLYRVNAGGPQVSAIDGQLDWEEDTDINPSVYLNEQASNRIFSGNVNSLDASVDAASVPLSIYASERFDDSAGTPNMSYAFPVTMPGNYEIRLYMGEGFITGSQTDQRIFDVQIEGVTLPLLNDIDLAESFGSFNGGVFTHIVTVNDSAINIEFIHGIIENPMVNAIEILDVPDFDTPIYLSQISDQINEPGSQINNGLAVQAFGGDGNLSYEALNLPPGLSIEPTNGLFTGTIALNAADNSPYSVTINVNDSDGFSDDGASTQFLWYVDNTSDFRINAGGVTFNTTNLGSNWEDNATQGAQTGNGFTVNTGRVDPVTFDFENRDQASLPAYIDQATFDMLFAQERYDIASGDDMEYQIPIANGSFLVNFYFANFFEGTNQVGDRVFDILLEGNLARDNFDIVQEFGHLTGGMISLPVEVIDGVLNIEFGRETQNPLVNAIEIYRIDSSLDPIVLTNPGNQLNDVNNNISLQLDASGGNPMNSFVYFALGLPDGLSINPATGEISGTVLESASTGGPSNDGLYPVKVTVIKEGSAPLSIEFTWDIASSWTEKDEDLNYTARHECSFVQAGDKFYLMGGRESATNIDIYDYSSNTWQTLSNSAPFEFNHYQAVTYQGYIWVIGAFQDNNFPTEAPAENIWLFDPVNQNWIQGPEIPESRRRGSAGLVLYNDKFYVVAGNTVGHDGGAVPYLDEYDPKTGVWTVLADAPRERDHFGAVLIDDKIYVASGRTSGGFGGVFAPVIPEVDVYDISNSTWSTLPLEDNIPTPRAGTAVANFNNRLVVIGGEVKNELVYGDVVNDALKITEQYDPVTGSWTRLPDMNFKRHGTQAIVSGDGIYVLAGSPSRGGGNQKNMEFFGTDNASGTALQGSTLDSPSGVFVADNSSSTFDINVLNGNTGLWIDRMEITGANAVDFSIGIGELSGVLLNSGETHSIEVSLNGQGANRNALLTIYYGLNESVTINLSNNDVPPIVTNPGNQTNTEGDTVSLQIDATDNGTSLTYEATNLPPSLNIDQNTGLISGTIDVANQGEKIFQEENGYLLIEAESANLVGGWSLSTVGGAVGIKPDSQHFGNPVGGGQLTYKINITNTGVYRFNWRNLYTGNLAAENNDSWLKFPNDSNVVFFGYDGFTTSNESIYTNIIENDIYEDLCYPKGSGLGNNVTTDMGGTVPLGLGNNGYFKVYRTGGQPEVYEWESKVSDGDDHSVFVWFKNPGVYEFIVSERSSGHIIDKMVLYKVTQAGDFNTEAKLDALPESNFTGSSGGASDNSPYNVQILVTDDADLSDSVDFTWFVGSLGQSLFAVAESDQTTGNAPLTVSFTGSNSFDDVAVTGYLWDFMDGSTSTDPDPEHVFANPGTYDVSLTVIDGDGNTDTDVITIEVSDPIPPTAVLEANPTSGNEALEVSFTGSNSFDDIPSNIVSYEWDFGTGDISTDADPTYTFTNGGVYTVTLTVTDGQGLSDTATVDINVNGAPVAIATADVTEGNAPLTVNFTGSASTDDNNDIVSYEWDFGTGDTSTDADPAYTFTAGGSYTVSLTVTDGGGLTSTTTVDINVNGAPVAIATADVTEGNAPLTVNFTGSASTDDNNDIVSYEWDFGTGDTSTDADPAYTFTAGGSYTVSLTVTDGGGLTSTTTVDINVNGAPVAIATADVTEGNAPLTVNFTGSASTDDNNDIVSYEWDFGTGDISTDADPTYTFTNGGVYTVTLTVTDGQGLSDTATVDINVNGAPVAIATADVTEGNAPLTVNFTGSASTDDNNDIVSYEWDFGTGDTSTDADPAYTFTAGGSYTVSLTVTDGGGLTSTTTVDINVNGAPVAIATADVTEGNAPLTVNFTGSASTDDNNDIVSYEWDFGTGDTSTDSDPSYTFITDGNYTVTLMVTDGGGLSSVATVEITVLEDNNTPPIARIIANPTEGDAPLPVIFDGSTSSDDTGIVSYFWDFDDGLFSEEVNPVKTFDVPGLYTVSLTVEDSQGITDTATVVITVTDPSANSAPDAVASASVTSGQAPLLVTFTGSNSTDDVGVESYSWTFGDGGMSNEINPTYVYSSPGVYSALLTVTDIEGLTDTASITITVEEGPDNTAPIAVATATPLSGEAPLEVTFTGDQSSDDKGVITYLWDFDDGTTSMDTNPIHTFTGVGVFTVSLVVTDEEGLTDETTLSIEVSEPITNEAPIASASATPLSGVAPLEVSFDSSGSTDDEGIVAFNWDFKDGTVSNLPNPTHTFTSAGTYEVVLSVSDAEGLTDIDIVVITVNDSNTAPIAMATATPISGLAPLTVSFDSSSSTDDKGIASFFWDFDDGSTSTEANPDHTFTSVNTYSVTLTVQDTEGLSDSFVIEINVLPENSAPVAIASSSVIEGEAPLRVQFTGSSSTDDKGIIEYFWDFDDGVTSTNINPTHVFNFAGVFQVVLRVEDAEGLSNSTTLTITVVDNATAGSDSEMRLIVVDNPAQTVAQISVQNLPQGAVVNLINVHDSSGRLIESYLPQEIFENGAYSIPMGQFRDGLYYVSVKTLDGLQAATRVLLKNN